MKHKKHEKMTQKMTWEEEKKAAVPAATREKILKMALTERYFELSDNMSISYSIDDFILVIYKALKNSQEFVFDRSSVAWDDKTAKVFNAGGSVDYVLSHILARVDDWYYGELLSVASKVAITYFALFLPKEDTWLSRDSKLTFEQKMWEEIISTIKNGR